ncbi:O-succinylbenzoic acid--CoA ligase [Arthrobacter stackebrandtii]|uniref:O-succinylbenzoic acid--CoA ligase n=1 Tax=Arthrobacter stackebrandtii TaxID=272161 RepID=A0ABS4YW78_9MICC|nr:AMP-binding protein [Arthrobacter stackebrandtii]MBP2413063.1 O-succinylbenzoic acid--CoA ligase [Arthrobacter stackebrandtii]PYH01166.1 AMP-dependent synthetase [Arthrobacter stackebrandtii]
MNIEPLLKALSEALSGEGPAVQIAPDGSFELIEQSALGLPAGSETEIAAVVLTSGSTGTPKRTLLSVEALAASSVGTAMALQGEGQWLLALPMNYVAGLQVLVRSLFAGTRPWAMDLSGGFTPEAFTEAALELTDNTRFTSLVPTQLSRLLTNPSAETLTVLRRFNAILLGGGPVNPALLEAARGAGLNVVTTYGMSETCGGAVYNGVPLDGVELAIRDGRIWLGGPVVAAGYLGDTQLTDEHFVEEEHDGELVRWYASGDLGELDSEGRLRVLGRADDVIITGGLKVSAGAVTDGLHKVPGVREAFVVPVPSEEWGQQVAAMVVSALAEAELLAAASEHLEAHLLPKTVVFVSELPLLPNGKPDRTAILATLAHAAHSH